MDQFMFGSNNDTASSSKRRCVWVNGPVIVGAGPSGLAVGACLREQGVPFVILERADCIASLWQERTYDSLKLNTPKGFSQLPGLPFPESYPEYLTKTQFIAYLESYANHFDLKPRFREDVYSVRYDSSSSVWRVLTKPNSDLPNAECEYICQWLVVATGVNAEAVVPDIDGLAHFDGKVIHSTDYKSGEEFRGQQVLVVGCGNSGKDVSLDLSNHNAFPSIVSRSPVNVLPWEIMARSIFKLARKVLLFFKWLIFGKTPVVDIGAMPKILSGDIKALPEIKAFYSNGVELVNGEKVQVDSVILATGYRSNVRSWLQEGEFFDENGYPNTPFPNGWKGKDGLYAVGFSWLGIAAASFDAMRVAEDIGKMWKEETMEKKLITAPRHRRCISTF